MSEANQPKQLTFTLKLKQDAVRLVIEKGYIHPQAAASLGVSSSALRRWVRAERGSGSLEDRRLVRLRVLPGVQPGELSAIGTSCNASPIADRSSRTIAASGGCAAWSPAGRCGAILATQSDQGTTHSISWRNFWRLVSFGFFTNTGAASPSCFMAGGLWGVGDEPLF